MISRKKRQFEGQSFNGPVGQINGGDPGQGFEGQSFNGPIGSHRPSFGQPIQSGGNQPLAGTSGQSNSNQQQGGADQPSSPAGLFQFPRNLPCNCPNQSSRPGTLICFKDEHECQCLSLIHI